MRISYMGDPPYATVSTTGTYLDIQMNGKLYEIDCRERQKTIPVHIDVVLNADGSLGEDIAHGMDYVANIDIPAAIISYDEETGEAHQQDFTPSDFDKVRVVLWTIISGTGE